MAKLPKLAFNLRGYNDNFIKLIINEIYGFPEETSHGGGYGAKGRLEIDIDGYNVCADHYFTTGELCKFLDDLKKGYENLEGEVSLDNVDKELKMNLIFNKNGQVTVYGEFQALPDNETKLIFEMTTDQTAILEIIQSLGNIKKNWGEIAGIK